ncbi:TBC1 domain family member 17-like isoform X2 [Apostichopus japonicus]|uniref:TBC1 domain family member 17-like isoform X2 n=1 Tax=Stichopus japonicus TaxID=307972 RepID=UPI003AB6569A
MDSVEKLTVFEVSGVFIHTAKAESEDVLLAGKVQLVLQGKECYVFWNPLHHGNAVEQPDPDWTVVNTRSDQATNGNAEEGRANQAGQSRSKNSLSIDLAAVRSIRMSTPNLGWAYLVFRMTDDEDMPPLHFHEGGSRELISMIRKYVTVSRSPTDRDLLNVHPKNTDALSTSFSELQILSETSGNYVSKFFKDPVTATMGGFSRVTSFVRDNILPSSNMLNRPTEDYSQIFPDITTFKVEQDFDLIATTENKLADRPEVTRSSPLTEAEWHAFLDGEGRVLNVPDLKEKIFRGGIEPSIRKDLWPFLLCYYSWNSTTKERIDSRKHKEDEYFGMKAQWKTITTEQERRFSIFKERKNLIGSKWSRTLLSLPGITRSQLMTQTLYKDVIRTDRIHPFFAGEKNVHLDQLFSILMTYTQLNFDLGYVQGMSDILSPILLVMEDEVDAFWCFVGYMDNLKLEQNFDMKQEGMKNQLIQLNKLVQVIEPELYGFLQSKESSNMFFCFRWLLIHFKREFTFEDIMRLWEVMWTGLPCQNFHLLLCLAILDGQKRTMTEQDLDFNDILKYVNELSLKLNVEEILRNGESIFLQLKNTPEIPAVLWEIVCQSGEEESSQASESSIEVIADLE